MPEVAEINRYSTSINSKASGITFSKSASDPKLDSLVSISDFQISSESRGKELKLTLSNSSSSPVSIRFNFGLVGKFEWHKRSQIPDSCRLYFGSHDTDDVLCLVDKMNGASYVLGSWSADRGPCPLTQFEEFRNNILQNLNKKDFDEQIAVLLLNQKYFNGIGNYLRAEIMYRANVSPFSIGRVVLSKTNCEVIQLCHDIPQEVLNLGLNKYGTPEEVKKFEDWLLCYNKKFSSKDKKGRTLWYDIQQGTAAFQPSKSTPALLPNMQTSISTNYDSFNPLIDNLSKTTNKTTQLLYLCSLLFNQVQLLPPEDRKKLKEIILESEDPPEWILATLQAFQATKDFMDVVETLNLGLKLKNTSVLENDATESSQSSDTSVLLQYLTDPSWTRVLSPEFEKPYFKKLASILEEKKKNQIEMFPPEHEIFSAFNLTPFDQVKVVLLGQDPYHDVGQAHGLAFSVKRNILVPPSLKNMFRELKEDCPGFHIPEHGNLEDWAHQGVFLLNATLTVEAHKPNSHNTIGWQTFTDTVIKILSEKKSGLIFLLLGALAQKKKVLIDSSKHTIIEAAHPSPLSASKWFGCKIFSKTNEALSKHGYSPINWQIN